jgi:hypothetical protein
MLRPKTLMIFLAAAALGLGAALLVGDLPAKARASMMMSAEAPRSATPAPASNPAPVQNLIRIDGERGELRLDGKDTGLHADKDGVSLRTLYGKFDLRW